MPGGTPSYPTGAGVATLEGDRRLVTLFPKTGLITTNTIENFSVTDVNTPYYDAQAGTREAP